ncbi:MAG TPA: hypothetical protein VM327_07025 [Candidatus Thermoplasmatota archaeon]|nr:hypothetical protein [Candidatus Thermoplasmatota archaeon]
MHAARPLVMASLAGLALTVLVAVLDVFAELGIFALLQAHVALALFAFLAPALAAMTVHSAEAVLGRPVDARRATLLALLWAAGGITLASAAACGVGTGCRVGLGLGTLVLAGAAAMTTGAILAVLPKRRESVVDVARDPLTKGDDASVAHLRFAQFFLPPAVLLAAATGPWWNWQPSWTDGAYLAGVHLLGAHVLVSCYGLAHLWVPRLSGVPAIAAGAIKGELHSTLLGLVFLLGGFAFGMRGLVIAGGTFAFLGAFTFMGVIGANIMRNKSRTQRVTPEFTYIPWAFTAVFWLISGVLLGIFLNVVPNLYATSLGALRFTHVHIALLGGAAQVLLALAWRIVPAARGVAPPPFTRGRWGYWGLNLGLALLIVGRFRNEAIPVTYLVGAILVSLGLAASFMTLRGHGRVRPA